MDCIFCKIAQGEIPNYTVYTDEHVLAFLDIHPCSKGHTVVIPKKHFVTLLDMDEVSCTQLLKGVRQAAQKIYEALHPDGLNIGINNGKAAGQAVGHVHWHILPRWDNDGGGSMHSIIKRGTDVSVTEVAKLF